MRSGLSGAPAPAMQVISSLPSPRLASTWASVASGSPHATSDSPTKPTASPILKRPSTSSRAAGATEPLRMRPSAAVIAAAFCAAPWVGESATSAARAVCWLREGTTTTCFSDSSAACSAAMITFGLFGSTTTSSAATAWIPASSS